MIRTLAAILVCITATEGMAQSVVPTRTIRADATIQAVDVKARDGDTSNGFSRVTDVIGQEARVTLYAGRPILFDDIGPPALVDRNQIVLLEYKSGGLRIATEGRALQRGGIGDQIRIMNLQSRTTLFGQIQADGTVKVSH